MVVESCVTPYAVREEVMCTEHRAWKHSYRRPRVSDVDGFRKTCMQLNDLVMHAENQVPLQNKNRLGGVHTHLHCEYLSYDGVLTRNKYIEFS